MAILTSFAPMILKLTTRKPFRLVFIALVLLFPGQLWAQTPQRAAANKNEQPVCLSPKLFNFTDIRAAAVYEYNRASANLDSPYSRQDIQYNLSPDEIKEVKRAFDFGGVDGSELGASPSAYVYLKDSAGKTMKVKMIGRHYLLYGNNWKNLCPLSEEGGRILEVRRQIFVPSARPEARVSSLHKHQ